MNKINYNKLMEEEIEIISANNVKPRLLIHACCTPCSSSVIEKLENIFDITVLFYNPNIFPENELNKRKCELNNYIIKINNENIIKNNNKLIKYEEISDNYLNFISIIKEFKNEKEGGKRCWLCYKMRMERSAKFAKDNGFDYFTTTLSVSPHKNSSWINEIGQECENRYGVKFLHSDFKKENGYLRSIILSKKYNFYRQDYCGCEFSKKDRFDE